MSLSKQFNILERVSCWLNNSTGFVHTILFPHPRFDPPSSLLDNVEGSLYPFQSFEITKLEELLQRLGVVERAFGESVQIDIPIAGHDHVIVETCTKHHIVSDSSGDSPIPILEGVDRGDEVMCLGGDPQHFKKGI